METMVAGFVVVIEGAGSPSYGAQLVRLGKTEDMAGVKGLGNSE